MVPSIVRKISQLKFYPRAPVQIVSVIIVSENIFYIGTHTSLNNNLHNVRYTCTKYPFIDYYYF